jgi:hypothetical protein
MRSRLAALGALLGASALLTWNTFGGDSSVLLEGSLDLGHGVAVRRVRLDAPRLDLVVATIPRRSGLRLRAVLAPTLTPLAEIAGRRAIVAVNGDYHELQGFLTGKTYSSLVEGGDPTDLARYKVVGKALPDEETFWLDTDRVPHISALDLGGTLGLPGTVSQGKNHRGSDAILVSDPLPGKQSPDGWKCFALEPSGAGFRVSGSAQTSFEGKALVVRESAVAAIGTALAPGTSIELSVAKKVDLAIGTGPRLLEKGEVPRRVVGGEWVRAARTAVGFDDERIFLVVTVQEAHNAPTMAQMGEAMKALGCREALNLDGGPSTALWAKGALRNTSSMRTNDVGSALCVEVGESGKDDVR